MNHRRIRGIVPGAIRIAAALCIAGLLMSFSNGKEDRQERGKKEFVREARRHAVQFSMDRTGREQMLEAIGEAVGSARIVAISESAHNVKEFIGTNADITRYLIEHKGFNTVVIESGFPESITVNDYIQGEDIDRPVWTSSLNDMFGRWLEFTDMIDWMREYNKHASPAGKVRFYGLDIAGFYTDLRPAFGRIADGLEKIDSSYAVRLRSELNPVLDVIASKGVRRAAVSCYRDSLTSGQKYLLEEKAAEMTDYLTENRDDILARLSEEEYGLLKQEAVTFFQTLRYYRNTSFRNTAYREFVGLNGRDLAMKQNFDWVFDSDTTARIVIISHNIHTKTRPCYLDDTVEYFIPFCAYVKKRFGNEFYNIGCAYDNGEYWDNWKKNEPRIIKRTPPAGPGEIDYVMKEVGRGNFFIDFHKMDRNSEAWTWLDSDMMAREHDEKFSMSPGEFDGFIYYDSISLPTGIAEPGEM